MLRLSKLYIKRYTVRLEIEFKETTQTTTCLTVFFRVVNARNGRERKDLKCVN